MRALSLTILLFVSSFAEAEQVQALLYYDEVNEGKVQFSYRVRLELGDPAYTHVKAIHFGKRDSSTLHPQHTDQKLLNTSPVWTHETSPPQYNLMVGTHEYCSTLSPFSEFYGGGLNPLAITSRVCHDLCWDPCPSC
jgi:hypothetical protein